MTVSQNFQGGMASAPAVHLPLVLRPCSYDIFEIVCLFRRVIQRVINIHFEDKEIVSSKELCRSRKYIDVKLFLPINKKSSLLIRFYAESIVIK